MVEVAAMACFTLYIEFIVLGAMAGAKWHAVHRGLYY